MKKYPIILLLIVCFAQNAKSQQFPQMDSRKYISDTIRILPKKPWLAASEVFGEYVDMGGGSLYRQS